MQPITDVNELFRRQRAIRNFTAEDIPDALVLEMTQDTGNHRLMGDGGRLAI